MPISANGANFIYTRIVRPFFLKHHGEIESTLDKVAKIASKAAEKGMDTAYDDCSFVKVLMS